MTGNLDFVQAECIHSNNNLLMSEFVAKCRENPLFISLSIQSGNVVFTLSCKMLKTFIYFLILHFLSISQVGMHACIMPTPGSTASICQLKWNQAPLFL